MPVLNESETQIEEERIANLERQIAILESVNKPAFDRISDRPTGEEWVREVGRKQLAAARDRAERARIEAIEAEHERKRLAPLQKKRGRDLENLALREQQLRRQGEDLIAEADRTLAERIQLANRPLSNS